MMAEESEREERGQQRRERYQANMGIRKAGGNGILTFARDA